MINEGEDELICDLAETYQIYDYKSLPVRLVAIFSCGLDDDSRIKRKLRNEKYSARDFEQRILVALFDRINWITWSKTEDGTNNVNQPDSLYDSLYRPEKNAEKQVISFSSGDDFVREYNRRIQHANNS